MTVEKSNSSLDLMQVTSPRYFYTFYTSPRYFYIGFEIITSVSIHMLKIWSVM